VGTGFSFTDEGGYSKNEIDVGNNLYEATIQFFTLFPELQDNDFYVTGESYAGKYVSQLT
jgi:vitellogenic carboxypeptidase-like protein